MKMDAQAQKIVPHLWFDREAEEAAYFYASLFRNASVGEPVRASKAGFEIHGLPAGTVMTVPFRLGGLDFAGINGGPLFKFNPSVSFLIACKTPGEVDALWDRLSAGGSPLMELGAYPFSERYGWTADRYGLSWQVMATGGREIRQKIVPTLMYAGAQAGRAEEAIRLYTSIFGDSGTGGILRYGKDEAPDREGTVKHAAFTLEGLEFAAMDSARGRESGFNEAVSLMRLCETQDEIDRFWAKLTAGGGQEGPCGWLKDKFGVSWQIAPIRLQEMLRDPDTAAVERVTNAFLKMKKLDLDELEKAFRG
jgi:predicted 3-demethylubiquinone-9 3-methyltransferase (glyoxalase superfamily)